MLHLALNTDFYEAVEVFAALSPCSSNKAMEVSKAIKAGHQRSNLARESAMVLGI